MVKCSSCGKSIEKLPDWMQSITVDFVCNNCPNRQTKNIAFVSLDPVLNPSAKLDAEPEPEIAEDDADDDK